MTKPYPTTSTDWLIRLINYDTVSSRSNLELIDDVQAFLQSFGLSTVLTKNDDATKANLFATIYNKDDTTQGKTGGIVLSGHTDVVPTDGQAWTHNPFDGYVKDGKVYGRGACDMKGFIACVLAFIPRATALAKDNQLKTPLHIALSFDEEIGCLGAPLILEDLRQRGIAPEYCIVGEPTLMQVVTAHKGISVYTCSVHGKSVHSSLTPGGVNAISYAAHMINYIDELAQSLKFEPVDTAFNVPFGTLSVGTIEGGIATNIVPNLCQFSFEYRNLPFNDPKKVTAKIYEYADTLTAKCKNWIKRRALSSPKPKTCLQ